MAELFLDLNRALVWQFAERRFSKEFYLTNVHIPHPMPPNQKTLRLFDNPLLEMCTYTFWWVVPLIWLPIASWFYRNIDSHDVLLPKLCLYGLGLLLWTILEYLFHRFVFHMEYFLPDKQWALCFHFLIHGNHHLVPHDPYRLVMPPLMFASLFGSMWCSVFLFVPYPIKSVIASGAITGYVCYDMCHYFFHNTLSWSPQWFIALKKNHMAHHYGNPNGQFGVTNVFWDRVIGSGPRNK